MWEGFVPWLLRIAANRASDMTRKGKREQSLDQLLDGGHGFLHAAGRDLDRDLDQEDEILAVMRAVERLPEKYRMVVMLRYFEGLSGVEIANVLGEPEGTVRNRLFRAHEKLRGLVLGSRENQSMKAGEEGP